MIYKRIIRNRCIMIVLLLCVALVFFMPITLKNVAYAKTGKLNNYENYVSDFLGNREIVREEIISDGGNNKFLLIETNPSGYVIFAIDNTEYTFVEGAKTINSPFYEYNSETMVYLGPMEYYIDKGNYYLNILSKDTLNKSDMTKSEYNFISQKADIESIPQPYSMQDNPIASKTYQENGYTFIKDSDYFKKLSNFPDNDKDECGIVALCMLLGYFDTYKNDNFISNKKYLDIGLFANNEWFNAPYTTNVLRDYLKTFGHRLNLPNDSFAMADMELKATMKDYVKHNCAELVGKCVHYSGSIINTHKNPRKLINDGTPVILVIVNYEKPDNFEKGKAHSVIAYGYKNDTFVTHFGWDGEYSEVYLSKYTAYAYYAMEYNGEHVHSKNALYVPYFTKYYCGCGEIISG